MERMENRIDCFVKIEKEELRFKYSEDGIVRKEIKLAAGYELIVTSFFHQPLPTEAETDRAINYIEDALMSDGELLQYNQKLYSTNEKLVALFRKNEITEDFLSRQMVEELFSRYARVIMGAPLSTIKAEITTTDFVLLLLLREIMHHLNFDSIHFLH